MNSKTHIETKTDELLIEFFSEEIPARMQRTAAQQLKEVLEKKFKENALSFTEIETYVTPRRLTAVVSNLLRQQPDVTEEKKGPRIDAPQQALEGFSKSAGLPLDQCEKRDMGDKGTFYFATTHKVGQSTRELLPALLTSIMDEFHWPKSMRWRSGSKSWVRPLHSGICLLGGSPVPFSYKFGETEEAPIVHFSDTTKGHRFLSPEAFRVTSFEDYKTKLNQAHVVLDSQERQELIMGEAKALADKQGLSLVLDAGLLEEISGLVEWPTLLLGQIDPQFMDLPEELLLIVMKVHQRYLALRDNTGKLAPYFIITSNMIPQDGGALIIQGNERVLRARFSDAKFYFDQDRSHPLDFYLNKLQDIVYHDKLGTMTEKVDRLQNLAGFISERVKADKETAVRAAQLAKADLCTGLVFEFPELQGIIGRYYANAEASDVSLAIAEHYLPKGPSDALPAGLIGSIVSLSDKIDALVGFFAVGVKPTGSKDPYALRRAALGIIRLCESMYPENLTSLLTFSYQQFATQKIKDLRGLNDVLADLNDFIVERIRVLWRDQGISHDTISAVLPRAHEDSIDLLKRRALALQHFLNGEDGQNLLAAYRRASNIVTIEEKKDGRSYCDGVQSILLQDQPEKDLFDAINQSQKIIETHLKSQDFQATMKVIADLRPLLDLFFEHVTVNAPEASVRVNRLNLLSQIKGTLEQVADFSKLEVK